MKKTYSFPSDLSDMFLIFLATPRARSKPQLTGGKIYSDIRTSCLKYGGFHKWGYPISKNGCFIMENPVQMDDLGVPSFQETSIYAGILSDIYSDILSVISSDMLSGIAIWHNLMAFCPAFDLAFYLSDIRSGIPCGIQFGVCIYIYISCYVSFYLAFYSGNRCSFWHVICILSNNRFSMFLSFHCILSGVYLTFYLTHILAGFLEFYAPFYLTMTFFVIADLAFHPTFYLAFHLTFYLAFYLTFYLAFYECHIKCQYI